MEGAGQEGWGLEGLLGSLSCSGATGLVELGLPGWGGGLIPACRGVDFCPPPSLGSRSTHRENGNGDLLRMSFFAHNCFLFSCPLTEGGQNSEASKSSTHRFPSLPAPSLTSEEAAETERDRWRWHASGSAPSEA